jgi:hypothetical protein
MTVRQLIQALQEQDQDLEVMYSTGEWGFLHVKAAEPVQVYVNDNGTIWQDYGQSDVDEGDRPFWAVRLGQ